MNEIHYFVVEDCFKSIVAVHGVELSGRNYCTLSKIKVQSVLRIIILYAILYLETTLMRVMLLLREVELERE